jgi:hypothetical protein
MATDGAERVGGGAAVTYPEWWGAPTSGGASSTLAAGGGCLAVVTHAIATPSAQSAPSRETHQLGPPFQHRLRAWPPVLLASSRGVENAAAATSSCRVLSGCPPRGIPTVVGFGLGCAEIRTSKVQTTQDLDRFRPQYA